MSTQDQSGTGEAEPVAQAPSRMPKIIAGAVIFILFVIFVLQNSDPVEVKFLFFDARIPLIWVFIGCAVIGALILYLVERPGRRVRKRYIKELERERKQQGG